MPQDLVVWFGPVGKHQVTGATVPGAVEHFIQCVGAGAEPLCKSVAASLLDPSGRRLPMLCRKAGLEPSQVRNVFLGAFSAGGGVVRALLEHPDDRRAIRAVLLADATYSATWADQRARVPVVQEPLVAFATELARGGTGQLLVATASPSPNYEYATGVEVLRALRAEVERRTGLQFKRLDSFFGIQPEPEAAYQLGDVILAEYPMQPLGHGGHAGLAPQVWQRILLPWLERGWEVGTTRTPAPGAPAPATPSPVGSVVGRVVAFVGGAAVGAGATWWLLRGRRA